MGVRFYKNNLLIFSRLQNSYWVFSCTAKFCCIAVELDASTRI